MLLEGKGILPSSKLVITYSVIRNPQFNKFKLYSYKVWNWHSPKLSYQPCNCMYFCGFSLGLHKHGHAVTFLLPHTCTCLYHAKQNTTLSLSKGAGLSLTVDVGGDIPKIARHWSCCSEVNTLAWYTSNCEGRIPCPLPLMRALKERLTLSEIHHVPIWGIHFPLQDDQDPKTTQIECFQNTWTCTFTCSCDRKILHVQ